MARFDLHMHSRHSFDGIMAPSHIVGIARRRGLAGIAVSDHNTIAGGVDAVAANPATRISSSLILVQKSRPR